MVSRLECVRARAGFSLHWSSIEVPEFWYQMMGDSLRSAQPRHKQGFVDQASGYPRLAFLRLIRRC